MQNILLTPGTYVVATLNNLGGIFDRSPRFVDNGIPYVCVNQPVVYNPGVTDADGNDLAFALINARFSSPLPTNVTYQGGYSGAQPFTGITISPTTGQLNFTPTTSGYYVVVIEVSSFNSSGQLIGKVMRDLMFAVTNCDGAPPYTSGIVGSSGGAAFMPGAVFACTGLSFCVTIPFTDFQTGTTVNVTSNANTVLPGSTFSVSGTNPATATICWTGNESILPQIIWLQASDGGCPISNTMSISITALDCATLPVEVLGISAKTTGNTVQLEWSTATETGSDRFIVERSADGLSFVNIGEVEAAGTSVQLRNYEYFDRSPLMGNSYYRLRQRDLDGSESLSPVVSVALGIPANIVARSEGSGAWSITGAPPGTEWALIDGSGRTLQEGAFRSNSALLSTDDRGLSFVRLVHAGQRWNLKLPAHSDQHVMIAADGGR